MLRIVILFFILTTQIFSTKLKNIENTFIDITHKYISEKVENISILADGIVDSTSSYVKSTVTKKRSIDSVDELFKNKKYIEETKKSYLRLSTDYSFHSLENSAFDVKLSASLALNKSTKRFKLYISGFKQNNVRDLIKKNKYDEDSPEAGISYVALLRKNTEVKYSLGIRSLYPYAKARISYKKKVDSWTIEPVQNVQYSTKGEFKEDTKLYLDRELIDKVNFRLQFSRGTSNKNDGMDYSSVASIFWELNQKTGIQLSQGVYGNTKYEFVVNDLTQETKRYNKINNYSTTLTLRQSIYRKWLFYELSPGVNFHKSHDFEPNYRFYVKLDAFFGKM